MINCTYYHGSRKSKISQLKINRADDNPFGPAVYLTKDPMVADCYHREGGAIYEVNILGNTQFTIDLDKSFIDQSAEAIYAILRSLKSLNQSVDICPSTNARDFIHPYGCSKSDINDALSQNGIWLLYGHLSGMEVSGLMDRGVQFAVIDESALKVSKETSYSEIVDAKKC